MRHIIPLLLLSASYLQSQAQMHISTNLRADYTWNATKNEFELVTSDPEQLTFFDFNKDFTTFKHTTPTITSAYLIKSYKHDTLDKRDQYQLEIVSDVGNAYTMYIDIKNNNVRFFYTRDGKSYLVRHTIKKTWMD
jgi:hypothetical protein